MPSGPRCTFRRVVTRGMVPDIDETLLQYFFGPVPSTGNTYRNGKQFRRAVLIQRPEGLLIAQDAAGKQAGELFRIHGCHAGSLRFLPFCQYTSVTPASRVSTRQSTNSRSESRLR